MIKTVFNASKIVKDSRTQYRVLASAMEEMGELAQEIKVANKHTYKPVGKDGIIGEAVDVIACMLDLIYLTNPEITEEEIEELIQKKCDKWIAKAGILNEQH